MSSRENYVEELTAYTQSTKKELSNILANLEWTSSSTLKNDEDFIICPFDSAHRILLRSFEKHIESCQWAAEGYGKFDVPLSRSMSNDSSCIMIDEDLQKHILTSAKEKDPTLNIAFEWQGSMHCLVMLKTGAGDQLISRTSNRLFSDFTSDERRCLYDYVVSNTTKNKMDLDIADLDTMKLDGNKSNAVSKQDLLALERDMKRRSVKHKGVHTNKKSQTEILREVINQQMEIYAERLQEKNCDSLKTHYETKFREIKREERGKSHERRELHESKNRKRCHESLSRNQYVRESRESFRRSRSRSKSHKKSRKKERHRSKERRSSHKLDHDRHSRHKKKHKRRRNRN